MDIFVLNNDLEPVGIIDSYTSLIWANRYNEVGDCELYISANSTIISMLKNGYYLTRQDDEMVCRIETIELQTSVENGDYLIVKGFSVSKILNQRVVWLQTNVDGNVEEYIRNMVQKSLCNPNLSARQIRNTKGQQMFYLGNKAGFTDVTTEQVMYNKVGDKIQEICKSHEWGYKVVVDNERFYFMLYKGTDRSDTVIFSNDFENLISTNYVEDSSNLANVALVGGEGEGSNRTRNISGYAEGINRNEIFVDAKDISRNITWEELTKMYPTTNEGGYGSIYITTEQAITYKMDKIDIAIVDNNQLSELQINYPNGQVIYKQGNKYYQIYDIIIADLKSNSPESNDDVILRDLVYSVYLLNKGYEKLAEYGRRITFEGSVEPNITFKYKKDYFLGDLVTIINEYGISAKARIVEVIEKNDDNGYSIEPRFEYIKVDEPTETIAYLLDEDGSRLKTEDDEFIVLEESGITLKTIGQVSETKAVESGSKKISELPTSNDMQDAYCMPIVANGQTKKVTYETLKNKLAGEIGGTDDYESLINKPKINDVELKGNKSFEDLNLNPMSNLDIEDIFKE